MNSAQTCTVKTVRPPHLLLHFLGIFNRTGTHEHSRRCRHGKGSHQRLSFLGGFISLVQSSRGNSLCLSFPLNLYLVCQHLLTKPRPHSSLIELLHTVQHGQNIQKLWKLYFISSWNEIINFREQHFIIIIKLYWL